MLTRDDVNILNRFRIEDLAKNDIIDSLKRFLNQDSVYISKLAYQDSLQKDNLKLFDTSNKKLHSKVMELEVDNQTKDKKIKRTRTIGVVSSLVCVILGAVLTFLALN